MFILTTLFSAALLYIEIGVVWDFKGLSFLIFNRSSSKLFYILTLLFISYIILLYVAVTVFIFLFKFKLFGLIGLRMNHQTDKHSLLYASGILSYFTFPITKNFLSIVMDSQLESKTSFYNSLNTMDFFTVDGVYITNYFHFIVLFIIFLVLISTNDNFMTRIGIKKYIKKYINKEERERFERELIEKEEKMIDEIQYYYYVLKINSNTLEESGFYESLLNRTN